ncbi:unnamed protein product [Colias eurytheme]|nr:unnamed protein product [Colias eurytheme]
MWKFLILTLCCTLIHSRYVEDEDMLLLWRRANTKSCKPFTKYTVDCNQCVCGADGTEFCTRMACIERIKSSEESEYTDHN